jgi:hypothetical protein
MMICWGRSESRVSSKIGIYNTKAIRGKSEHHIYECSKSGLQRTSIYKSKDGFFEAAMNGEVRMRLSNRQGLMHSCAILEYCPRD